MKDTKQANLKNIEYQEAGKFEDTRFEKIHNVIFRTLILDLRLLLGK